jgi:hypothetical protein
MNREGRTLLRHLKFGTLALLLSGAVGVLWSQQNPGRQGSPDSRIPHLVRYGSAHHLIVDGKPFLMLAGELGNSSASDPEYMRSRWNALRSMHLNTVLVPVYWELCEPQEGKFDFRLVDSAIFSARRHGLKVVFLWFGTWKNSMSCYVPGWVKTDEKRFPRSRTHDGRAQEIVTPFSRNALEADARAFSGLMRHIKETDDRRHTVIMIQVENEIGMIPEARDHCDLAEVAFREPVPPELLRRISGNPDTSSPEIRQQWHAAGSKSGGTWEEVFGKSIGTDEIFMAWHFARYANAVTERGKEVYPLPMYVNAALIRPGYKPGQYPSAGPLPHLFDVWKIAAPGIDFLAPDVYFRNFAEWCAKYDRPGNPLFVPEVSNEQSVANAFFVFARHNAMGYSPFSIESLRDPDRNQVSQGYDVLGQLEPMILEHQGKGTMSGVLLDSADQNEHVQFGQYLITFKHEYTWPYAARRPEGPQRAGGLIIMTAPGEFLIAGSGIIVTFESIEGGGARAGILSMDEGRFEEGKWISGRRMNGDQDHQGRHLHLPGGVFEIQRVKLYTYQ